MAHSLRALAPFLILLPVYLFAACEGSEPAPDDGGGDPDSEASASYAASGRILNSEGQPAPGVVLNFGGAAVSVASDGEGKWFRDGLKGDVTVTPEHNDYDFEPESHTLSDASDDINFLALPKGSKPTRYTVSGTIVDTDCNPIVGAVLSFGDAAVAVASDGEGRWSRSGLEGEVTVTPQHRDYVFGPSTERLTSARTDVDFVGTSTIEPPGRYRISGTVRDSEDQAIAGVVLSFGDAAEPVESNTLGEWSRSGLEGLVIVTPSHPDFAFEPKSYPVLASTTQLDIQGQRTFTASGRVRDLDGDPVEGALITLVFTNHLEQVESDASGRWSHSGLFGTVNALAWAPAYLFSPGVHTFEMPRDDVDFTAHLQPCTEGDAQRRNNPCILTELKQIQAIKHKLDGHYALGNHIDASSTEAWNSGKGFEPLGSEETPFTGSFNGRGFNISGLYISRNGESNVGLFGYVRGTIQEVSLLSVQVHGSHSVGALVGYLKSGDVDDILVSGEIGKASAGPGSTAVGGVIGWKESGLIRNAHNTGSVFSTGDKIGGILGHNENGTVQNCTNSGNIDARNNAGGIVGYNENGTILNCSNAGRLRAANNAGGILGYNENGAVEQSFNIGELRIDVKKLNSGTGGVVGTNTGRVINSYNLGEISGRLSVGGVVGKNLESPNRVSTVENVFNAGYVEATGSFSNAAGLVAESSGTVKSAYFDESSGPDNGVGEPKTDEELQQKSTYQGWDFVNIWSIEEGKDYPDLRNNPR